MSTASTYVPDPGGHHQLEEEFISSISGALTLSSPDGGGTLELTGELSDAIREIVGVFARGRGVRIEALG
ncbi:hypothetical protein [Corynebacterium pacaense]|uniref:hypothetical protein n=1 Tax=Corynebacterium pacaense TaxID=1816684 RepID=UPI0009BA335C|nr:hypothetical protein [Corynebacterium pacaense]